MKKVAVIIGSGGQDGTLLTRKLKSLNYEVIGVKRGDIDLLNIEDVGELIHTKQPDEVYHLAAYHHSSEDSLNNEVEIFKRSIDVHAISVNNLLDAIDKYKNNCRFFYASSCLIFKGSDKKLLTENSPYSFENFYAISKITGGSLIKYYRDNKKIFACSGFLFNHESSLRTENYLSKKITSFVAQVNKSSKQKLILGSLDMKVDWGYAPDYVDAFWRILQNSSPDDYIVATGVKSSVKDFVKIAFEHVNLDYRDYVIVDSNILSRKNNTRIGSAEKLMKNTGWKPSIDFYEMVGILVDQEIERFKSN